MLQSQQKQSVLMKGELSEFSGAVVGGVFLRTGKFLLGKTLSEGFPIAECTAGTTAFGLIYIPLLVFYFNNLMAK